MTLLSWVAWAGLALAALPALMVLRNLGLYRGPAGVDAEARVSVLIPARDEAAGIAAAVSAALAAGQGLVALEVVVLDDGSADGTADIVRRIAADDPRVRLETAAELPPGWNGKQHACAVLAEKADAASDTLVFVDADVRLQPGALAGLAGFLKQSGAGLVSGVPRQVTGSWMEVLIVPQIVLVLLGYLPMGRMRADPRPSFGAGCGQLFVADRAAYAAAGGHGAIRASMHDGVDLPRAFRRAGQVTDLLDVTGLATCRMYDNAGATWRGFSKNARGGMGSPRAIGPWTLLLLGGHVLPWVLLAGGVWCAPVYAAAGLSLLTSVLLAVRFKQGIGAVLTRPLGVAALVLLQWVALAGWLMGRKPTWRGRSYPAKPK